jgi:hypothetical protein
MEPDTVSLGLLALACFVSAICGGAVGFVSALLWTDSMREKTKRKYGL